MTAEKTGWAYDAVVHTPARTMIDDGQALREAQPGDAAERRDRSHADPFAAFTMNKPSVPVVVKKHRGMADSPGDHRGAQSSRVPHVDPGHEERRPRVYQVHPSTSTRGNPQPAWALERSDRRAGAPDTNGPNNPNDRKAPDSSVDPAGAWPARRRRARRDPAHAPGQVTRIVFETPPRHVAQPAAESRTRPLEFIEHAGVGYEQVMAELQQLSAQLDLALSARRFRIG